MSSDLYSRAKALFFRCLEQPSSERLRFVDTESAGDDALRHAVLELLIRHTESSGSGIDAAPAWPGPDVGAPPRRFGPWTLLDTLGSGGMGVVYRARRDGGPIVALKVLRPLLAGPEALGRLEREAIALRRIEHPGIARYLESGTITTTLGPLAFVAMECIDGVPLREYVARLRPDDATLFGWIAAIADAVDAAHRAGVVHRDLKPENVLMTWDGEPRVLDFGIARIASETAALTRLTRTGLLLGTPAYMSPEQARGDAECDARSDVYSLGVMGYELLCGAMPYPVPVESPHRALLAVLTTPPRPLGERSPTWRGDVERVFGCALRKDPNERYASMRAFADDLRRVAAGRAVKAPRSAAVRMPKPRWPRFGLTIAAAVALAIGFVRSTPHDQDTRTSVPSVYAAIERDLEAAESARGVPTAQSQAERVRRLEDLRTRIMFAQPIASTPDLIRYVDFKLAMARTQIANERMDGAAYDLARQGMAASSTLERPWGFAPPLPDTTLSFYGMLCDLGPDQPWWALASIDRASADYVLVEERLQDAWRELREADRRFRSQPGCSVDPDWRPADVPLRSEVAGHALMFGDCLVALSEATDSVTYAAVAVPEYRRARELEPRIAIAATLGLSRAFRQLAVRSRSSALLDSAEAGADWVLAASSRFRAMTDRDDAARAAQERAAVERVRARWTASTTERAAILARAAHDFDSATAGLSLSARQHALLMRDRGALELDRAALDGTYNLYPADSMLVASAAYFAHMPVLLATVALEQLRAERLRELRGLRGVHHQVTEISHVIFLSNLGRATAIHRSVNAVLADLRTAGPRMNTAYPEHASVGDVYRKVALRTSNQWPRFSDSR